MLMRVFGDLLVTVSTDDFKSKDDVDLHINDLSIAECHVTIETVDGRLFKAMYHDHEFKIIE